MKKNPTIDLILEYKREEVKFLKETYSLRDLEEKVACRDRAFPLITAMAEENDGFRVIAEIKRSSPFTCFKPVGFDPASIARSYQLAGAAAVSVVTESRFFAGSSAYIPIVKSAISIPVLRKDFIVDKWQVAESAALGADVVLLMAINHESCSEFREIYEYTLSIGIEPLVEVHSEDEWRLVEPVQPKLVGINNRDFYAPDLKVDLNTSLNLAPKLPADVSIGSESGISNKGHLNKLRSAGVSGFLIGSSLMQGDDPGVELAKLLS